MRTTIRLDERLLADAKKLAADNGCSLTAFIENAVREVVSRRETSPAQRNKIVLPVFKGRGLRRSIDLDNSADLLDVMDELP